jgi:hypothetical protein
MSVQDRADRAARQSYPTKHEARFAQLMQRRPWEWRIWQASDERWYIALRVSCEAAA